MQPIYDKYTKQSISTKVAVIVFMETRCRLFKLNDTLSSEDCDRLLIGQTSIPEPLAPENHSFGRK